MGKILSWEDISGVSSGAGRAGDSVLNSLGRRIIFTQKSYKTATPLYLCLTETLRVQGELTIEDRAEL